MAPREIVDPAVVHKVVGCRSQVPQASVEDTGRRDRGAFFEEQLKGAEAGTALRNIIAEDADDAWGGFGKHSLGCLSML